jgi:hypothetical protein
MKRRVESFRNHDASVLDFCVLQSSGCDSIHWFPTYSDTIDLSETPGDQSPCYIESTLFSGPRSNTEYTVKKK